MSKAGLPELTRLPAIDTAYEEKKRQPHGLGAGAVEHFRRANAQNMIGSQLFQNITESAETVIRQK